MQPIPIPVVPFEKVTMDFMKLNKAKSGYDTIMVIVDQYTKLKHFLPTHQKATAMDVAQLYLNQVV